MKKVLWRFVTTALCLLAGWLSPAFSSADPLNVAVANSTCKVMQALGEIFEQRHGTAVRYQCKASGLLAKGLKGGAINADIYVSASKAWMDYMQEAGMVDAQQVTSPWGNELVVAAAKSSPLELAAWSELGSTKVETILIGDPSIAPFGRYAKQALLHTALWEQAKRKVITKKHITLLADSLAVADAATVGILFASNTTDRHRVLYRVDKSWHTPIRYFAAPLKRSANKPMVIEWLRFMQSEQAQGIFKAHGFIVYVP